MKKKEDERPKHILMLLLSSGFRFSLRFFGILIYYGSGPAKRRMHAHGPRSSLRLLTLGAIAIIVPPLLRLIKMDTIVSQQASLETMRALSPLHHPKNLVAMGLPPPSQL